MYLEGELKMKKWAIGILFAFIAVTHTVTAEATVIPAVNQDLCAPAPEQCLSGTLQAQCKKRSPAEKSPCIIFSRDDDSEIEISCSKKILGMPPSTLKRNVRLVAKSKGKEIIFIPNSWNKSACSFKLDGMVYLHNDLLLQFKTGDKWVLLKKLN